jgi:hypothetical protein
MSKKTTAYYILGALFLAAQVVYTVYQGSLVVNYGSQIAELESQKQVLAQTQQRLQTQASESVSLMALTQTDEYNQFQPIAQTVKLTAGQAVASR